MDEGGVIMNKIVVEHACKSFGKNKILNDVSISCPKGSITGIVGHNGSGKTVLFKSICGFYSLDSGKIIIDETSEIKPGTVLKQAGIIIENPAFIERYSGLKNLELLYGINNKCDKKYLRETMDRVGLDAFSRKKVANYSMGMKQRLAIAQAIMEDKDILILDEPMNGLDVKGIEFFRELFLSLKKEGKTMLMASHNREDIEILCDKVYKMENGCIIE
jgi:ABC-2 type transport system ATP-binding protein